jgi:primosomal protein N' (replication factor Y)
MRQKALHVSILNTTHDYFDYLAPDEDMPIGARVSVTLRGKKSLGIVVGKSTLTNPGYQLRPIDGLLDESPVLSQDCLSLIQWAANYYHAPLSEGLKGALPKRLREGKPFAFSKKMIPLSPTTTPTPPLALNAEQKNAVDTISKSLDAYSAFLLFGVTGSGKTEVYFHLMDKVLAQGKQVLIIVPEIGLTPQLLSRVAERFSYPFTLLHSRLNDTERLDNWLQCHHANARILIGTRSAIFTPLPELGLIIIDEEHDLSFKQQDSMRYSARDLALKRAHDKTIPIILGSATPSLESLQNAIDKKYHCLRLTTRAKTAQKNRYKIVDLRNQYLTDGLAEPTLKQIEEVLKKQKQVMVFINRRGFSPILICHACGFIPDCPRCSAHLTLHHVKQRLLCHHCQFHRALPKQCETCQSKEFIPVGAGTERVTQFLSTYFKDCNVLRIDKDTTSKKGSLEASLKSIEACDAQLLVGTQLLAKGHHFPKLELVVILDADSGFYSHDFRAIERLGQQILQVSGRAGREAGGEILIQTHLPDNPFLNLLIQKGYDAFATALLKERKAFHLPPFQYLALIRTKGRDMDKLMAFLSDLSGILAALEPTLTLLGPAPAPMPKKAGLYRAQLLIKSETRLALALSLKECREMIAKDKTLKRTRYTIDIDTQDLS